MTADTTPRGLDFLTILRILLRRWYVVLVVLGLTALAITQIIDRIEPEYGASGSVLLQRAGDGRDGLREPLTVDNYVMAEVLASDDVRSRLAAEGLVTNYEIIPQESSGIINIAAFGASTDGLIETVRWLLTRAEEEMQSRQGAAGLVVDPDALRILSSPTAAVPEAITIPTADSPSLIHYVARGSVAVSSISVGGNPYGANSYTTRVLVEGARDPAVLASLGIENSRAEFELGADPRDPAPIIAIEVTGPDADDVTAMYEGVVGSLTARLQEFQDAAGVAPSAQLELQDLSRPTGATLLSTNTTRPMVAIAGLGLLLAATLALVIDPVLMRLRQRRREASGTTAPKSPVVPAPPDVEGTTSTRPDNSVGGRRGRRRVGAEAA